MKKTPLPARAAFLRAALFAFAALVVSACPASAQNDTGAADPLAAGFEKPPVSARPLGWWHWINGNITKDGIAADLQAATDSGMGGVQMFDVEIYLPPGPIRYGTEAWHDHVQFAIRKAAELGLEFHAMNTPGWSASAGPWVPPERSMKRLVFTETDTDGGAVSLKLEEPDSKNTFYKSRGKPQGTFYKDIAVIAVPADSRAKDLRKPDGEKNDEGKSDAILDRKIGWGSKPITRPTADTPAAWANTASPIAPSQVINLTARMDASGKLTATLPEGRWTILRFGFTTTGKTNHPAVPEGLGLEIDKFDADAVAFQFEQSMGRMIRDAGPLAGKTFSALLFDSFEGGYQNWTDKFPEQFARLKNYDLLPWLPVLAGRVIETPGATEAVLWDFRDVIEELIAENYFGTMHRLAARHGIKLYSESQGGPLNPMAANRHVDVPMNEFWTPEVSVRASRIKQSTSSAMFLGRPVVAAEAYTSTPENGRFQNTPASLKRPGDQAFTLGLNRYAFHSFTHQPVTAAAPGFSLGRYGVHFGRLNTWWPYASAWIEYLSRCQFLLQQGRIAADICLLVDEDLGYGLPSGTDNLAPGHDYEVCYPHDLAAMRVRDGLLTHPNAGTFRLLLTPNKTIAKTWVAQLDTLRRLRTLVETGAILSGDAPAAPAGLQDLRQRAEFDLLTAEIWGGLDTPEIKKTGFKKLGAGKVYIAALKPADILKRENIARDLAWKPAAGKPIVFRYIHRATPGADIYFVFNDTPAKRNAEFTFRQPGRTPEIWDPMSGRREDAPAYSQTPARDGITVPLTLEPWGSTFVVFRRPLAAPENQAASIASAEYDPLTGKFLTAATSAKITYAGKHTRTLAFPPLPPAQTLAGPWTVEFKDGRGAPPRADFPALTSWHTHADPGIRFYSGTAVYRATARIAAPAAGQRVFLDLGKVADIARVFINGRDAGILWTPPFRADITALLKPGANALEIHVANRWINRLIGDEAIPTTLDYQRKGTNKFTDGRLLELPAWLYDPAKRSQNKRHSFSVWKHYDADAPLVPAGLLGPVRIEYLNTVETGK